MARFYGSERSKYGNLTGQIIIWPVQIINDLNSSAQKEMLPSGYLRCDGSIYNAIDYPQLAAICGVGESGKFVRRDLTNQPLQVVSDQQFVVPDLGSKYPKPTTGPDAGQYKSIRETNANNNEISRAGVGIEASSTIGTTVDVTYTGVFNVPSQIIDIRGRPSWTIGTTAGKQTDTETVDQSGLHGHMHFHAGKRTRLKATNEVDDSSPSTVLDPTAIGMVAFWNASTIPLADWLTNTMDPTSGNYPGNNQPPCRGIASSHFADGYEFPFGNYSGTGWVSDPTAFGGGCFNGGEQLQDTWKFNCLLPSEEWMSSKGMSTSGTSGTRAWSAYPISQAQYAVSGMIPNFVSGSRVIFCLGVDESGTINTSQNVSATWLNGAPGVNVDWKGNSLFEVTPFNSNSNSDTAGNSINPGLFNDFSETQDIVQESGDPTAHFHKVDLQKLDHTFQLKTDAVEISPDALKTTLNLSVDNAVAIDSVASPFIVLEYLIKI